jgi:putative membrane protein
MKKRTMMIPVICLLLFLVGAWPVVAAEKSTGDTKAYDTGKAGEVTRNGNIADDDTSPAERPDTDAYRSTDDTKAYDTGKAGEVTRNGNIAGGINAAGLAEQDQEFVKKAAKGGLMEVQLGTIAAQRASSSEVKQFGQMMVDEHSKANQQLMEIAAEKNIQLPRQLDSDQQETIQDFSKKSGSEFDSDYMSHMVDDHQEDIDVFKEQAEEGRDPALKQFASTTVPKLEKHLQKAKQIEQKVNGK